MKLRTRFLLVLAAFTVLMVVAAVVSSHIVLTNVAQEADETRARGLLQRGESILKAVVDALAATTKDWAAWDDTYTFMVDRNERYREANLLEGTLVGLRVNAMAYYDAHRHPVACLALNSARQLTDVLPEGLRNIIERDSGIAARALTKPLSGFVFQGSNLWLIAASPVLTSRDEGPARGTLVIARLIDAEECKGLSRQIDSSLNLIPVIRSWPVGAMDIRPIGLQTLHASVAMADIFGDGRLALALTLPRRALGQVSLSLMHLSSWLIMGSVGLWLISVWLLNRWVLRGVTESVEMLRSGLEQAKMGGGLHPSLKKIHDDELGDLLDAVNSAITTVETTAREADRRRAEAVHSQRLAALGTLSAGIAHEINNPNGIISLNLNLLRRELKRLFVRIRSNVAGGTGGAEGLDPIEKEVEEVIRESLSASDRIAGVVTSLKWFTQPEVGLERDRLVVSDLLDEACHWLRHEYRQAQCRIEKNLAPNLPLLIGKKLQLLQVFVNLLQNACQASTRPGMVVRLSAIYDHEHGTVVIEIADEGRGMPPEDVEHALDPFFTTRREEGGMGLGLSISAAIVKAHEGRLHIESQEGAGTVVTVVLPVREGEARHAG